MLFCIFCLIVTMPVAYVAFCWNTFNQKDYYNP